MPWDKGGHQKNYIPTSIDYQERKEGEINYLLIDPLSFLLHWPDDMKKKLPNKIYLARKIDGEIIAAISWKIVNDVLDRAYTMEELIAHAESASSIPSPGIPTADSLA